MLQGFQQGASQIAQGAALYILSRKEPSVITANVLNVSAPHVSKASATNPAAALQGFVVDLTLSAGNDTTTVEFPVNSLSANYPEKGWFISPDRSIIIREVESMANMSRQVLSQVQTHQKIVQACDALLLQLNPERQEKAQQEQKIASLENQIAAMSGKFDQLVGMLSAALGPGNKKKKEE